MKLNLTIYRGYANKDKVIVIGHVFKSRSPDKYDLAQSKIKHAWAVIRMFSIKTISNATVELQLYNHKYVTRTLHDGYFRFTIPYTDKMESGWHEIAVSVTYRGVTKSEKGTFIKPHPGEYGIISDIDDTFLISHSRSFFKRIYVLLTKNIHKRKTYENTVQLYDRLDKAERKDRKKNILYYVSSSEWNLYHLIVNFMELHRFPKGILKLKSIKKNLFQFLAVRKQDHEHKFYKIKHILEFHPELKFILLGDDGQHDAQIYERICKIFSENIKAVYIRQTRSKPNKGTENLLKNIQSMGVMTCYFKRSMEAIKFSEKKGIFPPQ